ncbi:hypothetical protein CAC42_3031 [Sphaceloma murrayae]|uniref:DUF4604 domain-containing protein n=1 Tax=Sphaceloma murrayae TaxID=2082308 RepID=A0A2K1QRB4_9PEZI|nr:hypothetical protein CAC42_3031 [Sphaceloma murrayae]
MSSKLKGLQYESEQPAFLQRMRAAAPGDGRHERPIPRPKRARQDDDEDAPAYVMEETNESLSKDEYEKLVSGANGDDAEDVATSRAAGQEDRQASEGNPIMSGALPDDEVRSSEQAGRRKVNEASLGVKKRKAATVVGQDDDGEGADNVVQEARPKKGKKKGKAIKLSFNDDEG